MRASLLLASAFSTLVASLPVWDYTPYEQSTLFDLAQCRLPPVQMFLLDESKPDNIIPLYQFQVYQGPAATNRQYVYVQFPPNTQAAATCELHWTLPQWVVPLQQNAPQLDIKRAPSGIPPNWNTVVSKLEPGVWGTVNTMPPQEAVVNSGPCSTNGLAFVFKLAQFIEQGGIHAAYQFTLAGSPPGTIGPYLTSEC